jgi:hypothetical protein
VTHPYPYPGDDIDALLADVGATEDEAQALREVLQEAEAEEAAGLYGDPPPDDFGPWHDFGTAAAAMDRGYELDGQRVAEDIVAGLARRPRAEDILQRDLARIEAGTFTGQPAFQPAPDGYGRYASACGEVTDVGTCANRYHDPDCGAVIAASAATGDAAAAEAWARTLRNHPPDPDALPYAAELAGDPDAPADTWAGLLAPPAADPRTVHQRMLALLEDGAPPAEPGWEPIPPEQMPDVTGLRANLGC